MEGGWGVDTFVFRAGDGNDTITDFWIDFRGRGGDKIHLSGISGGFGALDIRQDGDDVIIRYGDGGDTVTLLGVRAEFLDAGNFKFGASSGVLLGGGVDDTLYGGAGDDTLGGNHGDDTLYGDDGDDTLDGSHGDDTLYGGAGDDTLDGSWDDDTLYGNDGDDTLDGNHGDDTLTGGSGDDTLTGGAGSDTFALHRAGADIDTITDFGEGDRIRIDGFSGGFGALDIRQDGDDAIIRHGGSAVRLQGVKADSLDAGDFQFDALPPPTPGVPIVETLDDPLSDDWNGEFLSWGSILRPLPMQGVVSPIKSILKGTAGNDTLTAKVPGLAGVLLGGDGDDTLIGGSGNQVLHGGSGNDTLHDGSGGDRGALYGGSGDDTLHDGSGKDTLYGGAGSDTFVFRAGGGNNTIADFGEGDRIRIDGDSDGFGALDIRQEGDDAIIRHGGGTIRLKGVKADSLGAGDFQFGSHGPGSAGLTLEGGTWASSILTGGGGDDTLYGGAWGDDTLHGGAGDDTLDGGAWGDSTLHGGDGNDSLYGSHWGDDILNGGAGDDTLHGKSGNDIYVFRAGDGNDTVVGFGNANGSNGFGLRSGVSNVDKIHILGVSGGFEALDIRQDGDDAIIGYGVDGDTITLLNRAVGSLEASDFIFGAYPIGDSGDDSLNGGSGTDSLYGRGGDDSLYGGNGDDSLYGGNGDDSLYGGNGDDSLYGGNGDDSLYGGHGDDTLNGGLIGDDTFVFTNDTSSSGDVDTILDFTSGDTIQLSGFAGVDDFGDLEGRIITTHGSETIIDLRDVGGGLIVLDRMYVAQLDADDFDFG